MRQREQSWQDASWHQDAQSFSPPRKRQANGLVPVGLLPVLPHQDANSPFSSVGGGHKLGDTRGAKSVSLTPSQLRSKAADAAALRNQSSSTASKKDAITSGMGDRKHEYVERGQFQARRLGKVLEDDVDADLNPALALSLESDKPLSSSARPTLDIKTNTTARKTPARMAKLRSLTTMTTWCRWKKTT